MDLNLADSHATEALGRALAGALPHAVQPPDAVQPRPEGAAATAGGAVLYLHGELGAGKTTCVRALLRALGVAGLVRSPTYTLVETYVLPRLTCIHVDLYRLRSLTEVDELGLRDVMGAGALLLVEWPEKGGDQLPPADIDLHLDYAGESRHARLNAPTRVGAEWLRNLGHDTSLSCYVSNLT
jgi:tRNA threonylcarbamoyladenosine biosynthesis protein TsaE